MRDKITLRIRLYWFKNWINSVYWMFAIRLGKERSTKPIPEGPYCYVPDAEKNKTARSNGEYGVYYIKPCEYYKSLNREFNACTYLGIITDDTIFDDQCKICNVKDEL